MVKGVLKAEIPNRKRKEKAEGQEADRLNGIGLNRLSEIA